MGPRYWFAAGQDGPLRPLVEFDVRPAAKGVDALLSGIHARVVQRMKGAVPGPRSMDPNWMAGAVAVWAGMLAVALLGPAMQYSRLLYRSMHVPTWGDAYMQRGQATVKLMQLGFFLPVLMTLSQIPPLAGYWGLEPSQSQVVAGVLLLLVAATHYLATAPLAQSYLDMGLIEWHTLLHNGHDFEGKMGVVRVRLDLIRALLGKACAQLVSPALLAGSMGLLLLLNTGLTEQAAERLAGPRAAVLARLPQQLSSALTFTTPPKSHHTTNNINVTIRGSNLTSVPVTPDVTGLTDPTLSLSSSVNDTAESAAPAVDLLGLTEDGSTVTLKSTEEEEGQSDSQEPAAQADQGTWQDAPGDPKQLWLFLGHFLGWWTCLVWSVYACSSMTVYRMGLNSG